jgi:hypothetical protein
MALNNMANIQFQKHIIQKIVYITNYACSKLYHNLFKYILEGEEGEKGDKLFITHCCFHWIYES